MERRHHQPERHVAQLEKPRPAGQQRHEIVDRGHHRKDIAADQDVMQMCDNKVGIMYLPVELAPRPAAGRNP